MKIIIAIILSLILFVLILACYITADNNDKILDLMIEMGDEFNQNGMTEKYHLCDIKIKKLQEENNTIYNKLSF